MKSAQRDFLKKVRKLAETAEELRSGKQNYFFINRLVSIKSLCKDTQTAAKFVCFLAERCLEKARDKARPSILDEDEWENCKRLMSEAVEAIRLHVHQPTEETLAALRKLSAKLTALQPYAGERVRGGPVRTIRYWDALIVEEALDCILNPHAALDLAYLTARDYTQKYNASYGTGLILESVPMLEDIIEFWSIHGLGDSEKWFDATTDPPKLQKKIATTRSGSSKARQGRSEEMLRASSGVSFEDQRPVVADWIQKNGWIEIGRSEGSNSLIRVLDEGGLVWEGKRRYDSIDQALDDAEQAIRTWLENNY